MAVYIEARYGFKRQGSPWTVLCFHSIYSFFFSSYQVLPHFGRSPQHQKLQVNALADPVNLQQRAAALIDGHPAAKQLDGTVVLDALLDAAHFQVEERVLVLVFVSLERHGRRGACGQRRFGASVARHHAALRAAALEKRRGKTGKIVGTEDRCMLGIHAFVPCRALLILL